MPKITKVNCKSINIFGTCFQGYLLCTYDKLVDRLGVPTTSDGYKTDAEWAIEFADGTVATIYNWKDGKNYCGVDGKDVKDITEWHIGGSKKEVETWVNDYVKNSWSAFDDIRQEAQF